MERPPLNIPAAFVRLWQSRDELHVRSIRKSVLKYYLTFPLLMIFVNLEYKSVSYPMHWLGLTHVSLLPFCFCLGALFMLLVPERRYTAIARIAAVTMCVGFCLRFVPLPWLQGIGFILCWLSLGSSGICALLFFCTKIHNAERLVGILSEVILVNVYALIQGMVGIPKPVVLVLSATGMVLLFFCLLAFREGDTAPVTHPDAALPRENYWGLVYVIPYFIILQFFNEYIASPMSFSNIAHALGGLAAALVALIIQFTFRRSSWHIWNVLILSAVVSVLCFWIPDEGGRVPGSLFTGLFSYAGDIVLFYTCACVIKRCYSFRFFKRFLLAFFGTLLVAFLFSAIIVRSGEQLLLLGLSATIGIVFFGITMLSPLLYNKLFAAEWADELHQADMIPILQRMEQVDRFQNLGLTPREQEVCVLLLKGCTLRQIAANLGIAFSTVNTYYKGLYRKLHINSRAELFLMFGVESKKEKTEFATKH